MFLNVNFENYKHDSRIYFLLLPACQGAAP